MSKSKFLLVMLLSLSFWGKSQQILSLEEAMAQSLLHNHGVRVAKNEAQAAQNQATIGNAGLLPKFDLSGNGSYGVNNSKLDFSGNIPDTDITNAQSNSVSTGLQMSYTLFDGLGMFYNYDRLKTVGEMGNVQARLSLESTLLQVVSTYINIARISENLKIAEEAVSISLKRVETAREKANFGGSKTAVLNAEVDLNTDSLNLITLRQSRKSALRSLNWLMGRRIDTDFNIDPNLKLSSDLDQHKLRDQASQNNAAMVLATLQKEVSQLDLKKVQATRFPRLDLNAGYSYARSANEASIVLSQQNYGFNGSLALTFNLFDGRKKAIQVQNARLAIENSQEKYYEAKQTVDRDFMDAWDELELSQIVYRMETSNLSTAQQNFQRMEELFKMGQATSTQFREAQLNMLLVKQRIIDAGFNAKIAEVELLRLSGGLIKS